MSVEVSDLSGLCFRARALLSKGQVEAAMEIYDGLVEAAPEFALAYADRGTLKAMLKDFDPAIEDLEKAFALGHAESATYATAATVMFQKHDHRKALELFAEAVRLDPENPLIYYNRANVFHAIGDSEKALSDLKECLRFNPDENTRSAIARKLQFFS